MTAIWWIRRDLRLADNDALRLALADGRPTVPVFILDPHLLARTAPRRQAFLFAGLRQLSADLQRLGGRLIVRAGPPHEVLAQLVQESGAQVICAEEDYSPYARRRDAQVAAHLPLRLAGGLTVHHPSAVRKASDGLPYTVFTPFSKAWKALGIPGEGVVPFRPAAFPPGPELPSLPIPPGEAPVGFPAGETEAQRRLAAFLAGPVYRYHQERNRLDLEGTSQLSLYLRFGMLSARLAAAETLRAGQNALDAEARRGCETFLNELIWREFYQAILYHFPYVLRMAFNPALRRIRWRDDPPGLAAWQEGRTGYPVVDAAMRQLRQTGWMHNRGRMIVASFLAKDLLINWQEGERWFMQHLVDGDPAANNGGWQWTAGVGTDAAPYFRIFNPVLQGLKFDPLGKYIRRWLPELMDVPEEYLHQPWLMPESFQRACGCRIGVDYPAPLVEHALVKERTLAAYRAS